jgi:DNA-binding NtrC family response regulator
MNTARVVLVSTDQVLCGHVRASVESVKGCTFVRKRSTQTEVTASDCDAALVIVHRAAPSDDETIDRLIRDKAANGSDVPIVVISDENRQGDEFRWLSTGVTDCLTPPLDLARLAFLVDNLTLGQRCYSRDAFSPAIELWLAAAGQEPFCLESNAMRRLVKKIDHIADRDTNVLIAGETGSGKTRIAHLIHGLSRRNKHPFLAVNCAAIPDTLLESELFGHTKGAFTGAHARRSGAFAQVAEGTLFLDEIDMFPFAAQAKLLHVVEDRHFAPIGESTHQPFHGRLVVASNQPLKQLVEDGRFRQDLYYRIKILELTVPPLRSRRSEIRPLAEAVLAKLAKRYGNTPTRFSPAAMKLLERYDWPGNIRELHNVIERATLMCLADEILPDDVASEVCNSCRSFADPADTETCGPADRSGECACVQPAAAAGLPIVEREEESVLQRVRHGAEAEFVMKVLARNKNNRTKAARDLGISRAALYKKLKVLALA